MSKAAPLTRFTHGGGHCWIVKLPADFPLGDGIDDNERSQLRLLEDGAALGPAHAHHVTIREQGGGGFSHWNDHILLSTSDNSDPNANGRAYSIELPSDAVIGRDPSTIPEAARNAIDQTNTYLFQLRQGGLEVKDANILELGPGKNFGAAVLLAAAGARVTVADPFLAPWVDGYHRQLFAHLRQHWPDPHGILARLADGAGFAAILTLRAQPAEDLGGADAVFDGVVSNAVLEHLEDFDRAIAELARVSRPGAVHYHSVDVQDHQGYGRYLEHLLMDDDEFHRSNAAIQRQRGSRLRPLEFIDLFRRHGFVIAEAGHARCTDEAYFQDILSRLRQSTGAYAQWPEDDLRVVNLALRARLG